MENEKKQEPIFDESWVNELLDNPHRPQPEINMDETAIFSAGLIHPADMELEQIIQEAKAMDGELEEPEIPPQLPEDQFRDDEFRDVFGDTNPLDGILEPDEANENVSIGEITPPISIIEEEPTGQNKKPVRKLRPAMKKGYGLLGIPHLLATAVWAFVILAVGVSLGRLIWVCASDVLAFGKSPKEAVLTIREEDDLESIADMLQQAGLIKYPQLFMLYMNFTGNDELQVGVHRLSSMIYDYHAIKTALEPKAATRDVVEVVIPEGYTCAQVFALLEEKGVCSAAQLEEYAANGDLNDYWFLEGVERGNKYCLEGYLFPDTYQFYKGHNAELVLEKMLDNFDYRFTDIMKDKIDGLNERLAATLRSRGYGEGYINEHKMTIREVVIVASMIERETANGSESYKIASVIYNRLTNPANFPYLNIDATVIYGMGGKRIDPETGESLPLTQTDLQTDTPYNTYTRKGLIPGPIANPGRNSLNAALDPDQTDYYYYVYSPAARSHLFAKTVEEHEQNKAAVKNQGN